MLKMINPRKNKQRKKDEKRQGEDKCKLAVCAVAKQTCSGYVQVVGSACLVCNLFPDFEAKVHLVTSKEVISSENLEGYFLRFKKADLRDKKPVKLTNVVNQSGMRFTSGLIIIPVDPKKCSKRWSSLVSLVNDRPFKVFRGGIQSRELYCHVVEKHGPSHVVTPYKMEKNVNGEHFLTGLNDCLEAKCKNLRDLCGCNSSLKPRGAPITTTIGGKTVAVGVLTFTNNQISPVLFSQLESTLTCSVKGKRPVTSSPSACANNGICTASTSQRREEQSDALEDLSGENNNSQQSTVFDQDHLKPQGSQNLANAVSASDGNEDSLLSVSCMDSASQSSVDNARQRKKPADKNADMRKQSRHDSQAMPDSVKGKRPVTSSPSACANNGICTASTSQRREEQSDALEDLSGENNSQQSTVFDQDHLKPQGSQNLANAVSASDGNEDSLSSSCIDSASEPHCNVNAGKRKKATNRSGDLKKQFRLNSEAKPDSSDGISSSYLHQCSLSSESMDTASEAQSNVDARQQNKIPNATDVSLREHPQPYQVQSSSAGLRQRRQRILQNPIPKIQMTLPAQGGREVEEDSFSMQQMSYTISERGSPTLTGSSRDDSSSASSDQAKQQQRLKRTRKSWPRRKIAKESEAPGVAVNQSENGHVSVTVHSYCHPHYILAPPSREIIHQHVYKECRDFGVQTVNNPEAVPQHHPCPKQATTEARPAHLTGEDVESRFEDDNHYKVKSGYVLVIHNHIFPQRDEVERVGSSEDIKRLIDLFEDFNFTTRIHDNLTQSEILRVMRDTSERDFSRYDCFVCVILSHGSRDGVYGTDDGLIKVGAITNLFCRDECPSLVNKPKIFLVQACHGSRQDRVSIECDGEPIPHTPPPANADFLICFSSAPGHQSYRTQFGSWFISSVFSVFKEYAEREHLMDMMLRVNDDVSTFFSLKGFKQMPSQVCMLRKKVFFNPKYSSKT